LLREFTYQARKNKSIQIEYKKEWKAKKIYTIQYQLFVKI